MEKATQPLTDLLSLGEIILMRSHLKILTLSQTDAPLV